jgi:hypothetical protein
MTQLHTEKPDLAAVFRTHSHKLAFLLPEQRKVMNAVIACRTAELGGHVLKCDECGFLEISYNSCRNRHCPKCQSLAKARWIMARKKELLPVPYFHIVFTFSNLLYPLALQNKKAVYDILFQASSETLKEVAATPANLGADIGFISILHTWDQRLNHHPHLHCIVPGGGLAHDKTRWIASPESFFLSIKILSVVFRAKFLSRLEEAFQRNRLVFCGETAGLADRTAFKHLLKKTCTTSWVVYAKRPFAGPTQVLEYLGRYTHRVAISNNRILAMTDSTVTFQWRDRKNGGVLKEMTLDAATFLLHVLPSGFMKIRHFGFLGNPAKNEAIALSRRLLKDQSAPRKPQEAPRGWKDLLLFLTGKDLSVCPQCGQGHLFVLEKLPKQASPPLKKTG